MSAKVLSNIPIVEQFNVEKSSSINLSRKWDIWKEDLTLFITASGINNPEQKKALLLHVAGREVREIYRAMPANENGDIDTYDQVIIKLDNYFKPKKNLSYERYTFKKTLQLEKEDAASYITRLRTLAESCEYQNVDIEIRDHFIASCESTKLRKRLLREDNLTLERLQQIARGEETASEQASEIEKSKETINHVRSYKPNDPKPNQKQQQHRSNYRPSAQSYKVEPKMLQMWR